MSSKIVNLVFTTNDTSVSLVFRQLPVLGGPARSLKDLVFGTLVPKQRKVMAAAQQHNREQAAAKDLPFTDTVDWETAPISQVLDSAQHEDWEVVGLELLHHIDQPEIVPL